MKKTLLFVLLIFSALSVFAQPKDGVIKVRKRQSTTPTIAGLAGGEIEGSLLCAGEGIVINKNIRVVSFVFISSSGDKEVSMKQSGNKLSQEACDIIALLTSGSEVYINEIAVIDNKGRESLTTPMRFKIK